MLEVAKLNTVLSVNITNRTHCLDVRKITLGAFFVILGPYIAYLLV